MIKSYECFRINSEQVISIGLKPLGELSALLWLIFNKFSLLFCVIIISWEQITLPMYLYCVSRRNRRQIWIILLREF